MRATGQIPLLFYNDPRGPEKQKLLSSKHKKTPHASTHNAHIVCFRDKEQNEAVRESLLCVDGTGTVGSPDKENKGFLLSLSKLVLLYFHAFLPRENWRRAEKNSYKASLTRALVSCAI